MNSKPAVDPQATVALFYSRTTTVIATVALAYAAGSIGYIGLIGLASGHIVLILSAAAAALVGVPALLPFVKAVVHAWRHKGPVVTFDIYGVTDVRKVNSFIPWEDVGQINLGVGETASYLCFVFKKSDPEREDAPRLFGLGFFLKRVRSLGDWNITLRMLACRKSDVLQQARRLRQLALRLKIIEMNKSNPQGWSGSL